MNLEELLRLPYWEHLRAEWSSLSALPLAESLEEMESDYLAEALAVSGLNWADVAAIFKEKPEHLRALTVMKLRWDEEDDLAAEALLSCGEDCEHDHGDSDGEIYIGLSTLILNAMELCLVSRGALSAWAQALDIPNAEAYAAEIERFWTQRDE